MAGGKSALRGRNSPPPCPPGFHPLLNVSDGLTLAKTCARHADEMQAEDIVVLDLRGLSSLADFFVICTATSLPHLKAVARDVRRKTEEAIGEKPRSSDGEAESMWLVLDYVNVVVHVFHEEKRGFYRLEDLWSDAPRVELDFLESSGHSAE